MVNQVKEKIEEVEMTLIERIKQIVEERDIEIGITFEKPDGQSLEVSDIRSDPVIMAKYFLPLFLGVRRTLGDFDEVKLMLDKNEVHFKEIFKINNHPEGLQIKYNLIQYVTLNYFEILDFFDFFVEVFEL